MFLKIIVLWSSIMSSYAWINECELILHNNTNIQSGKVVANGDPNYVFENIDTQYDSSEECKNAILTDQDSISHITL